MDKELFEDWRELRSRGPASVYHQNFAEQLGLEKSNGFPDLIKSNQLLLQTNMLTQSIPA